MEVLLFGIFIAVAALAAAHIIKLYLDHKAQNERKKFTKVISKHVKKFFEQMENSHPCGGEHPLKGMVDDITKDLDKEE